MVPLRGVHQKEQPAVTWIVVHIKGKKALMQTEDIFAVMPALKGDGSLICRAADDYLQVDESVEDIEELLALSEVEVEIVAND